MTAPSRDDAERVYQYLVQYITTKKYPPSRAEIAQAMGGSKDKRRTQQHSPRGTFLPSDEIQINATLEALQLAGKIRVLRPTTGRLDIKLATLPTQRTTSMATAATNTALTPPGLTVESAINWQRMLKEFRGVVVSKLTASQIARYYRRRWLETREEQAAREANVLLGFRFPELFLERHQLVGHLNDFVDTQRSKRGCKSCGAKFVKIRPNQRYCSARCRRREKAHRREATPRGKLVKSRQNKRYRQKYSEQERERRRQWRVSHPQQYRAQRSREQVRRRIDSKWNRCKYQGAPPALAGILIRQTHPQAKAHGVRDLELLDTP